MSSIIKRVLLIALIAILSLSACNKTALEETTLPQSPAINDSSEETVTTMYPEGEEVGSSELVEETEDVDAGDIYPVTSTEESVPATSLDPLPVDPQVMTFVSLDGTELSGKFYPAAQAPAPLIVLMHWAQGDQDEFKALAPWLQNRGVVYQPMIGEVDWLDPSWFPAMPAGLSFNVFTFTFRDCEQGCSSFTNKTREGWAMDAQAVVEFASQQYGVDPTKIQTIGASIGADGAAIGCYQYNLLHNSGCIGALSISPGGYLKLSYGDEVDKLAENNPMLQAWCLYAEEDSESAPACQNAEGVHYVAYSFPGPAHGMRLLTKEMNPSALQVLFTFITQ